MPYTDPRDACASKVTYRSAKEARRKAIPFYSKSGGIRLYPYKCRICGMFHLTKHKHTKGGRPCRVSTK